GQFFRLSRLVDYGLRTHVWGLYARSGERSYYNYAHGFNRFAGDLEMANYDTPQKFKGGFSSGTDISLPHYWGDRTTLISGVTGDDIGNWMLEYYLTGDAYAADRVDLQAEAFLQHWNQQSADIPELIRRGDGGFAYVRRLTRLYEWTWNKTFADWARDWMVHLIDFDVPNAITDSIRHGPLYKVDRNLFYMSYYYSVTGDELAKRAILQALDYKYRFWRFRMAFGAQAYPAMMYALAYRWTGNPNYLRVVDYTMRCGLARPLDSSANVHNNMHPTMALPAALALLAEIDEPIDPFPVVTCFHELDGSRLLVRVASDQAPVFLRCAFSMDKAFQEPEVNLRAWQAGRPGDAVAAEMKIKREFAFQPSAGNRANPRSWHLEITLPESLAPGLYQLTFPGATRVDVLESTAPETAVYAPEGFRLLGDRMPDYFRVAPGTETLDLFLGVPMTIYRPDGEPVLVASPDDLGRREIAVDGHHGVWSVSSAESGMVRLFNVEPVFSRSPRWLATGAEATPAPRFKPPTDETAFVPGLLGQALHLPGAQSMHYARGEPVDGRYAQFPGATGTVEFWFRPNWSSIDVPLRGGLGFNDRYFLRAGSHDLQYRRGRDRSGEVASLNLWAYGNDSNAGFTGRFWFEAGEWYHVAFTWQTLEGEPGTDGQYAVYVNGDPLPPDQARPGGNHGTAHYWPGRVNGSLPFFRREADEQIIIGPVNGTLAQLRVSDEVRYSAPFTPPETLPAPDRNTLVQFALDGDFQGVDGSGRTLELTSPAGSSKRR
ncbi:MAG: LamG-like jellyroll fold domain-containing protein, partial [Kiritimatiellia bacterium]